MTPTHPSLTTPTSASARITSPSDVNYAFLHRGSVVLATPSGVALRMELFQRRRLEGLSGKN